MKLRSYKPHVEIITYPIIRVATHYIPMLQAVSDRWHEDCWGVP